jgi:hypothetical protein
VQLELLMKPQTIDLELLTALVRSDLGLTLQVLRHARSEEDGNEELWRISDCLVHLGPRLLGLAEPLCGWSEYSDRSYAQAEAFWLHSKLVASVAEETARYFQDLNANPEQAYLCGLLHNLNRLPRILSQVGSPGFSADPRSIHEWVAKCNLPSFAMDILGTDCHELNPDKLTGPARVVNFARSWIDLCLPWAETCLARKTRFKLPLLQAANLICKHFPDTLEDPLVPFIGMLRDATLSKLNEVRPESSSVLPRLRAASQISASRTQRSRKTTGSLKPCNAQV